MGSQYPARQLLGNMLHETSAVRRAAFGSIQMGQPAGVRMLAARTGLDQDSVRAALHALVQKGMARLDADGRVVAVGGLSLVPSRHRLLLNGARLFTWCALDAVGIPAALRAEATAVSRCPHCGQKIEVTIERGRVVRPHVAAIWFPEMIVSRVSEDLCPEINMFCNSDHLAQWRRAVGDPSGRALSLAGAEELGDEWWGDMR